ncbi:YkgJ family cysteine cluster protein [bacterium]|nr:YkgJ family cysteine cluster protein [bacterium]
MNIFSKIKNIFEDVLLDIKNRLFSSKYVIKGRCKQCGNCCRNILFSTKEGYIKDEEEFKKLQKKYRCYRNYKISGVVQDRIDFQNGALTFECRFISKNNKCKIYPLRPLFCRDYPFINDKLIYNGVEMLDGCGYYFEVDKKFESYLEP